MSSGSILFNQTSNSLLKTASTYSNLLLTGDYTIEFFMKCDSTVSNYAYPAFLSNDKGFDSDTDLWFYVNHPIANKISFIAPYISGNVVLTSVVDVTDNEWHHIAVVKNGTGTNNITMYVDGISRSTNTYNFSCDYTKLNIGGNGTWYTSLSWYKGYFTNLRILNGTALYTSNFSVPIYNLTNIPNTVLLLNTFYNSPYTDSSSYNRSMITTGTPTPTTETPLQNVVCFNENTKILCLIDGVEKETPVQDIRPGILVKTLLHGYVPVNIIGTNKLFNPGNSERFMDRLYICKTDMYPELNEDLIITGCHAILVEEFKENQREETILALNEIYITDDKYRLIAYIDDRASPYEVEGEYNIYHIALENENYFSNYGIYANGLLVEYCSKRYLKELSKMTLL